MHDRLTATVLGLLALVAVVVLPSTAAAAEPPRCTTCPTTTVSTTGQTFAGVLVLPGPGGTARPIGGAPGGSPGPGCGGCYSVLVPACGNGAAVCVGQNVDQCLTDGGQPHAVLFFSGPSDPSGEVTGYFCLMPGQRPVPLAEVTDEVRRYLDRLVPRDPRVVVQPTGDALVRVPTLFRADMATTPITRRFFTGSGFAVDVTAAPVRWTWTFGEGRPRSFGFPGAPYDGVDPSTTGRHVTHTYGTPGPRSVQVVVAWEGSYVLAGLGRVDVGEVERPSAPVQVQVAAARSELVAQ